MVHSENVFLANSAFQHLQQQHSEDICGSDISDDFFAEKIESRRSTSSPAILSYPNNLKRGRNAFFYSNVKRVCLARTPETSTAITSSPLRQLKLDKFVAKKVVSSSSSSSSKLSMRRAQCSYPLLRCSYCCTSCCSSNNDNNNNNISDNIASAADLQQQELRQQQQQQQQQKQELQLSADYNESLSASSVKPEQEPHQKISSPFFIETKTTTLTTKNEPKSNLVEKDDTNNSCVVCQEKSVKDVIASLDSVLVKNALMLNGTQNLVLPKSIASGNNKSSSSSPPPNLFVVDKHHDAMLPMLDYFLKQNETTTATRKNPFTTEVNLPHRTLIHFDSHPDMACVGSHVGKVHVDAMARGKCAPTQMHKVCDISTWILPLVLSGHINEVVWISCDWCGQMDPGTYSLLVGSDNGRLKVAENNNKNPDDDGGSCDDVEGCSLYWKSSCCWSSSKSNSKSHSTLWKPWKLHVIRYDEFFRLPTKHAARIDSIFARNSKKPLFSWILDFDEDFLSCSNPFATEFKSMFGSLRHDLLKRVYEPVYDYSRWDQLRQVVHRKHYAIENTNEFMSQLAVIRVAEETDDGKELMLSFRKLCADMNTTAFGKKVDTAVNKSNNKNQKQKQNQSKLLQKEEKKCAAGTTTPLLAVCDLYPTNQVHMTGELLGLPHHISTAEEVVQCANTTCQFLKRLSTHFSTSGPSLITVATSRADHYVPDEQASLIHRFSVKFLSDLFKVKNVVRLDRPKFSVI